MGYKNQLSRQKADRGFAIVEREGDIQKSIMDWLGYKKVFAWRNNNGAFVRDNHFYRFGKAGIADIIGVGKGGRFIAIEVKRKGGKVTEAQQEFLKNVNDFGGVGIVAHSIDEVVSGFIKHNYFI